MNAIDTNLYNYLDDKWRSQFDSWSNNPAGYSSFADVMANTSEGRLYLDQLLSTGAISASMYTVDPATVSSVTSDTTSADSGDGLTATQADDASPVADNSFDFLQDDWASANPDKAALLGMEPGLAAYLCDNPEWDSLFVNGSLDDSASV